MALEYSLKMINKSREISQEHNDNTPLVVPVDCHQPETYNEAIARILRHSGVIDDGAYDKLRGVTYDVDDDGEDFDSGFDDDDEFEQSDFAHYEDVEFDGYIARAEAVPEKAQEPSQPSSPDLTSETGDVTDSNKESDSNSD